MQQKKDIDFSAIKALALDLDGTTLLPAGELGERTALRLRQLAARGIRLIVCTGRAAESSRRFCEAMGAQGPMVFFNGAFVAEMPSGKPVAFDLLPFDVVEHGASIGRDMGVHFQAFFPPPGNSEDGRFRLVIEKPCPEADFYNKHTGMPAITADFKEFFAEPGLRGAAKTMFITSDPAAHEEIRERMHGRFGDSICMTRTHPAFLETLNAGVSKGAGLKTVMKLAELDPSEVIAFGDEENDLPLFAAAGFSAAPSSAREKVREAADFVFGPNEQEGLAAFLEEMFGL